jgi:tRNA-dihydrouridine synthase
MEKASREYSLSLAPIRGVTDGAFRNNFAVIFGGFDDALSPFVMAEAGRMPREKDLADAYPQGDQALPTIPQILGVDPKLFLVVAKALEERGARIINWNIGCPYPMVTKRGAGAGILPCPEKIDAFLRQVQPQLKAKLSVKLRLGMLEKNEAEPVLRVLNQYPLAEVIVHPRTAKQMYTGHADIDAFRQCTEVSLHPLSYNGDIRTVEAFENLRKKFPTIRRWMIGRGALADPFLPKAIMGEAVAQGERLRKLKLFHDAMMKHYESVLSGPGHVLQKMTGWWEYVESEDFRRKTVKKIAKARNMEYYQMLLAELFPSAETEKKPAAVSKAPAEDTKRRGSRR